jgi:hypothetical protein
MADVKSEDCGYKAKPPDTRQVLREYGGDCLSGFALRSLCPDLFVSEQFMFEQCAEL